MLRQEDLLRYTRAQPFRPIKVHLTDGRSYEVQHPDMMVVTPRYAEIGVPREDGSGRAQRTDHVTLMHIVRVEPLEADTTAESIED